MLRNFDTSEVLSIKELVSVGSGVNFLLDRNIETTFTRIYKSVYPYGTPSKRSNLRVNRNTRILRRLPFINIYVLEQTLHSAAFELYCLVSYQN